MLLKGRLFLLLLCLLLAACSSQLTPTPAPTPEVRAAGALTQPSPSIAAPTEVPATATAAPTLTSTASPTPHASASPTRGATSSPSTTITATAPATARPSATATPNAQDPLAEGRWLQSIGDCAGARREFAVQLAAKPAPAAASEARYRMAQCYLRDEAPAEAATALVQLLDTAPKGDPYRAPAQFLLGESLSQLGRWAEAEARFQAYLPQAPELAAMIWQRIGAAHQARSDLPGAAQAYTTALQSSPDWAATVAIRRALADVALEQKDYRAAAAQYDTLRGDTANKAWIAEMQWLAGDALAKGGEQVEAQRRWQAAADADLSSPFAHKAIAALVDAGAPVDEYQRGVVDYHAGLYQLAIDAFQRLRAQDATGRKGNAWYYAGLCYLALDQTERGFAELGNLIAAYPDSPLWADAWMAKGRALAKADKAAEAIAAYRELAKLRPDAPQAPKALWQAAILEQDMGSVGPAVQAYLDLGRRYPKADEAWRAYNAAGLIYFQLGDWRRAGETWTEMAKANLPSWTRPVASFWLGRAQAAAGEIEAAQQTWQMAARSSPDTFYGLRAADWAEAAGSGKGGKPANQPSLALIAPASAEKETAALETWLRGWAGKGSLALPAAVLADPDWKRGQTLLALGLRGEALSAWGRVQSRWAKDPWAMAALAIAFRDAGTYRLSIVSAEMLAGLWGKGTMSAAPIALQRLAYPMAYAELVRAEAEKWGLDPRLLYAVIRQESHFETGATSSAGARGLMQVMPGTAKGIADRLGWQDFDPSQAYWPYINVALGANYVAQWLNHFEGSLAAALAAYNGGPGNEAVWRGWAPEDDDLMVSLINITETRVYVQLVWENFAAYQRLYPR